MEAIWLGWMFMFICPGADCAPRPGSDHILPPGSGGDVAPADGAGTVPGAPPGRAGLNVHPPPGAVCTSGDAGVSPPGGACGACAPGACAGAVGLRSRPAVLC